MFRNIWDRIKEAGAYLLNSRLVMLILVFCLSSSILIGRLFYLQIVKGEDYLQNYELSIRRTSTIQGTRGNIYDRNGELLAYNKLAYSVTDQSFHGRECDYDNKACREESGDQPNPG